jgi:4-hydroxy-tetrahydrodipicolinate reductase
MQDSLKVICRFLEAGVNVGTPSLVVTSFAPTAPASIMGAIRDACDRGGSSYYFSGVDPGFFSPTLAVALLKAADEVSEVRMQEIGHYGYYDVERVVRDVFGFGRPPDYQSPLTSGALIRAGWSGTVNAVASRMGIELEELRPFFANETFDRTHETVWGVVEAGTVAAVRFGLEGVYRGKPLIVLEHITRTTLDAAPHWPQAKGGEIDRVRHEYTVLIKGDPDIDCRVALGETRAGADAGLVTTAMLIVNAVPIVTEHPPGIVNEMDLPLYSSRNIV